MVFNDLYQTAFEGMVGRHGLQLEFRLSRNRFESAGKEKQYATGHVIGLGRMESKYSQHV